MAPRHGPDDSPAPPAATAGGAALRIDKWLWHARFLKTRSLAARHVAAAGVRVNGTRTSKPAANVRPGDVLTFALNDHVRVIKVLAPGARRGPAPEAQALYEDLAPPPPRSAADPFSPQAPTRDRGTGRPTKRDRRAIDRQSGG